MIRAALLAAFVVVALLLARPYSAAGQTIPPGTVPPLCRCEENLLPEPELLPKHYLPYIAFNAPSR